jgi:hypothetical protein
MPLRRVIKPVPLAPVHGPMWRGFRRWCRCGFRWRTCPDRHATVPTEPRDNRPLWARQPTDRFPEHERAAVWRRNGGRW